MNLPSELVSSFVKATKDTEKPSTESTVYGTIVKKDGYLYVRIDGAAEDQFTPIPQTYNVAENDRVVVMIKDHSAVVIGNISAPSYATSTELNDVNQHVTTLELAVAEKISTEQLTAEMARIDTLFAKDIELSGKIEAQNAEISKLKAEDLVITNSLTATNARIDDLEAKSVTTDILDAKYATIEKLEAVETDIHDLDSVFGDFQELTSTNLEAVNGEITTLKAKDAAIEKVIADKANIKDLEASDARIAELEANSLTADSAEIKSLQSDVSDIDTLIFGSASGTSIQSSFANAVIAQLADAQIKSAMIDSVSANKISSGDIITNNVRVLSEDGKLLISDETIQISDDSRVRVQIGKDASGDYSISIWDSDGNLMFSEGGITDSAIKDAIIRDDMVSETANISATKLDIESLFNVINNDGTNTLNASKIKMDAEGQTLDVSFTQVTSDIEDLDKTVSSQGTAISTIQGQISSKVWQQDINSAKNEMSTQYSSLDQKVDGISSTVAEHTTQISNKADESTVTEISNRVTTVETNLSGFQSTVSNTYATKSDVRNVESDILIADTTAKTAAQIATSAKNDIDNLAIGGRNLLRNSKGDDNSDWVYAGAVVEDDTKGFCVEVSSSTKPSDRVGTTRTAPVDPSTEYTFSADIWCDSLTDSYDISWLSDTKDEQYSDDSFVNQLTVTNDNLSPNDWKRVSWTFTTNEDDYTGYVKINSGSAKIEDPMDTIILTNAESYTDFSGSIIGKKVRSYVMGRRKLVVPKERPGDEYIAGNEFRLADNDQYFFGCEYGTYNGYLDKPCLLFTGDLFQAWCPLFWNRLISGTFDSLLYAFDETKDNLGLGLTFNKGWYIISSTTFDVAPVDESVCPVYLDGLNGQFAYGANNGIKDFWDSLFPLDEYHEFIVEEENIYSYQNDIAVFNSDISWMSGEAIDDAFAPLGAHLLIDVGISLYGEQIMIPVDGPLDTARIATISNSNSKIFTYYGDLHNAKCIVPFMSNNLLVYFGVKISDETPNLMNIKNGKFTALFYNTFGDSGLNLDDVELDFVESDGDPDMFMGAKVSVILADDQPLVLNLYEGIEVDGLYVEPGLYVMHIMMDAEEINCEDCRGSGRKTEICGKCDGRGYGETCVECNGIGYSECETCGGSGYIVHEGAYWCEQCGGNGVIHSDYEFCPTCNGNGRVIVPMDPLHVFISHIELENIPVLKVANLKLEKGKYPTDWSPAPEDFEEAIVKVESKITQTADSISLRITSTQEIASNAETLIQQLSHSISMLVTDGNGTSLMTQTENGWTFSTADIQDNVADIAEGLNALTNDFGDTASTVDVLKQAVDDLGEIAEYVKIGTYGGEPCIELGESDSEFKMRITNTRILFMEGSNVVAYISNQSLHIKKAVIEEELQQGGFVWKVRSNGNMGLIWKGVSS